MNQSFNMKQLPRKFRINAVKLALTYPQSQIPTRQHLLDELQKKVAVTEYVIAQEEHKDGGIHYHCALKLSAKMNTANPHFLDIDGEHGNYKSCTNWRVWVQYCLKEDREALCNIKFHSKQQANRELLDQVKEKGLNKMLADGEISLYNYGSLKRNYETFISEAKDEKREELPPELENPWFEPLEVKTELKRCHYWFYSKLPSLGKTTWGLELQKRFRAEFYNYSEIYQPQISLWTECVILDEYRGQLRITQLNQMCDGTWFYTAKGRNSWKLDNKPLIIVLSNKSIQEIYKNSDTSLVEARFKEMEIVGFKTGILGDNIIQAQN